MADPGELQANLYAAARFGGANATDPLAVALRAVLRRTFVPSEPPRDTRKRNSERGRMRKEQVVTGDKVPPPVAKVHFGYSEKKDALWILRGALPDFTGMPTRWGESTRKNMFDGHTLRDRLSDFSRDEKRGLGAWRDGILSFAELNHCDDQAFFESILSAGPLRHRGMPIIRAERGVVWIGISQDVAALEKKDLVARADRIQVREEISADVAKEQTKPRLATDVSIDDSLKECSEKDLIVAATITFAIDRETRRAAEMIIYKLAPGDVRGALHRLALKQLISRVGDDIVLGREERKAILRRVRAGEPHDSYFYQAIEHACEHITAINHEEARGIIDRIGKSLQHGFEHSTAEENDERGRKKAREMLGIIAKAQAAITPPGSGLYAEAAIGFAASGNLAGALHILRTSVAARATLRTSDICIIRQSVLSAAMFHHNHEAFEECLADGIRLWAGRAADPFPFGQIVKTAVSPEWRESLERAVTIGLGDATAEQREEVRQIIASAPDGNC